MFKLDYIISNSKLRDLNDKCRSINKINSIFGQYLPVNLQSILSVANINSPQIVLQAQSSGEIFLAKKHYTEILDLVKSVYPDIQKIKFIVTR